MALSLQPKPDALARPSLRTSAGFRWNWDVPVRAYGTMQATFWHTCCCSELFPQHASCRLIHKVALWVEGKLDMDINIETRLQCCIDTTNETWGHTLRLSEEQLFIPMTTFLMNK